MVKSIRNAAAAAFICTALFSIAAPSPLAIAHAIGALKSPIKPPKGGCVAKKNLTLYASPSKGSTKVGQITRGTAVTIQARNRGWRQVSGAGATGWTKGDVRCRR